MTRCGPEQTILIHPRNDLEDRLEFLLGDWLSVTMRNRKSVRICPSCWLVVHNWNPYSTPLKAKLVVLGKVRKGWDFPDSVKVHCRFARSEEGDRIWIFSFAGHQLFINPRLDLASYLPTVVIWTDSLARHELCSVDLVQQGVPQSPN